MRPRRHQEVARDQPRALVNQLIERVLAVGARLAPFDRTAVVVERAALAIDALAVALHVELLQIGGQAQQVLVVGQHRVALRAEEIRIPDAEQPERERQVARRSAPSGSARPSGARRRGTARSGRSRWRWRWAGRSTTTASSGRRPSPRTRTCWRDRCRSRATSLSLVETATKCFATCASSFAAARNHARAERAVHHGLFGRERLRRDDEERRLGLRAPARSRRVRRVDVGDEVQPRAFARVRRQRHRRHHRARDPIRRCRC